MYQLMKNDLRKQFNKNMLVIMRVRENYFKVLYLHQNILIWFVVVAVAVVVEYDDNFY